MKELLLSLSIFLCLSVPVSLADNADSLRINNLEQALSSESLARERLGREVAAQRIIIEGQKKTIDSLQSLIQLNAQNIQSAADQLGLKIEATNETLSTKANDDDLKSKARFGALLLALLLLLGGIVYFLLHRRIARGNADIESLKTKAEKLNEEILNQFSLEMSEMQKISTSLNALSKNSTGGSGTTDHSLIITLADRITFMEMTLFKMDPNVRGHKQLSKSIAQMKNNLLANNYEIVDMLGKPYNDGMKVTASFVEDDTLEPGKQIITGIIKPQINYNGTMIQAAQITVSQNI